MPTSTRSAFPVWSSANRLSNRTAVCGPACTVVWEGRSREASPYPDCLVRQFIHTFYDDRAYKVLKLRPQKRKRVEDSS